jgi:hypothetical protein
MVVNSITFNEGKVVKKENGSSTATLKLDANCITTLPRVNIFSPDGARQYREARTKIDQSSDPKWHCNHNGEFGEAFDCSFTLKIVETSADAYRENTTTTEYSGKGIFFLRLGLDYTIFSPLESTPLNANKCWADALTYMVSWRDKITIPVENVLKMLDDNLSKTLIEKYNNNETLNLKLLGQAAEQLGMQVVPFIGGPPEFLLNGPFVGWVTARELLDNPSPNAHVIFVFAYQIKTDNIDDTDPKYQVKYIDQGGEADIDPETYWKMMISAYNELMKHPDNMLDLGSKMGGQIIIFKKNYTNLLGVGVTGHSSTQMDGIHRETTEDETTHEKNGDVKHHWQADPDDDAGIPMNLIINSKENITTIQLFDWCFTQGKIEKTAL